MVNHHCCVVGCTSSTKLKKRLWKHPWMKDVQFFTFPVNMAERRLWIRLVRRENFEVTRHTRICSRHWIGDGPSVKEPHPTIFPHNAKWKESPGRLSSLRHSRKRLEAAEQRAVKNVSDQCAGCPAVREKSGKFQTWQKSGKSQGILLKVREINEYWEKSGNLHLVQSK